MVSANDNPEEGGGSAPNEHLAKDIFTISIISNTIRPKRQVCNTIKKNNQNILYFHSVTLLYEATDHGFG